MRDTLSKTSSPVSPPDTSWTARSQVNKRAVRLNKIKTYFSKPQNVILLLFGVVLTISTFMPVVSIVQDTITIHPGTIDAHLTGRTEGYTVVNYIDLFTSPLARANLWVPLFNTLLLAVFTCIISIVYGGFFAFLVTRTNLRFKRYLSSIFIFPYIMPQWTLSVVWRNVFYSNKVTGTSNGLLASLFGIHAPQWWCQGLVPSSIVLGLHYAPFAYILIGGIFKNMDSNLEEAATILDTPRWKTMSRITLPMIKPAILSTILLVFGSAMGSYPVPHYLNLTTLATKYISLNSKYTGQASILAIVMMLFGVAILLVNNHAMKSRKNYTTVTGKSGQLSKASLGKIGSWLIGVVLLVVTFFTSIFPILSFALETLLPNPGDYSFLYTMNPEHLTTKWWLTNENITENGMYGQHGILYNDTIWSAFWGTLLVALSCMLIAGTIGTLVGYAVSKNRKSRWANYVNGVAFLPYLMPSIAVGAALFVLFSTERLNLFNTYWLLIIAGVIKYIPFASRASLNSMLQLSNEIEEAAIIQNIAWHKRMFKIIVPIQKSSIISGYMLPFMTCLRELPLFLLLCTQGFILATTLDYFDEMGLYAFSSAINLILIVTILFFNTLVNKLTGVSLDNGIGGK
ncbi:ABC transporter permease [Mobiluncus mulieris]|uniref:ABC transporter permease n=1 Tax=Mobiluncus mulieris TaxID=2052 RepID=UPI00201687F4|nr:iron ABC transporter permease [Mobiluncus mulieris]